MKEWTTACPDWESRILKGEPLIPPPLFPEQAEVGLRYFRELRIVDAPGSPTMGEACRPWLLDFVGSVFGAYDAETGRRLLTEFFLLISKKNAKSTGAAGIMLSALLWNWRQSAEFLILAPTIEVANNSFFPARDMVRQDEELSTLLYVQDHYRTITHRTTNATLKVVAADNEAVGGKKATGVLIDELWLFGKRPGAENMLREATGGLASRPEGFVIYATTQSDEPPAGVFRQKLDYARGVRDGRIKDKRFLPVLYEFPQSVIDAGGHLKAENLRITNPNLGASVDVEFLERELQKAKEGGPESLVGFLSKHANVEIGLALKSDGWAGADYWEAQGMSPGLSLDDLISESEVLTVGIDGGGLDDLLGLCVMGRRRSDGHWLAWHRAYAHPSVLERRKSEAPRFKDFANDGDLILVESVGEDVDLVADAVQQCHESGLLDKVGVDPAGIGAIVDAMIGRGLEMDQIVGVPQGWKLNGAIKTAERKLAAAQLHHGGTRLMNWCTGNAKVVPVGNAITITKQASGTAKIDPLMATFNATSLMMLNPQPKAAVSLHFL